MFHTEQGRNKTDKEPLTLNMVELCTSYCNASKFGSKISMLLL